MLKESSNSTIPQTDNSMQKIFGSPKESSELDQSLNPSSTKLTSFYMEIRMTLM